MEEIRDPFQLGHRFYTEAYEEIGNIIYDERLARIGLLVALVTREHLLLAGPTGGAKTQLIKNAYRLIEGLDESSVADITPSANLTEEDIRGGSITTTKRFEKEEEDGKITKWTETTETAIKPLVTPNHHIIVADEVTRTSPPALNALLSAMQERCLVPTSGKVELPNLLSLLAAMNQAKGNEAIFQLSVALVSRFAIGVVVGYDRSEKSGNLLQNGIETDLTKVKPVVSLGELAILRQTVNAMNIPTKKEDSWRRKTDIAEDVLYRDLKVSESGRLYKQVGKIAKTLALFDGTGIVSDSHHDNALYFAMASRVGATTKDIQSVPEILRAQHTEVLEAV